MMTHIFCAFAGGLITGVAVLVCPHWFSLISHAQYDDTLRTQRDLRLAAEDRLENYQDMLTQSQGLTQRALEELGRRAKALEYLRMRLYYVEKYLEQTKKPKAQSSMAAGQILVDRSL